MAHVDRIPKPPEAPPAGRTIRQVLHSLRRTYGDRAPSYFRLWKATLDGRVSSTREPAYVLIYDDDETVAAALGLTRAPVLA